MAKVYRYEFEIEASEFNYGPYSCTTFLGCDDPYRRIRSRLVSKHGNDFVYPSARTDIKGFVDGTHYCGCDTLEGLKKWFSGFNKAFIKHGFNLVEYEVKAMLMSKSGKQVGFDPANIISRKVLA